MRLRNTLIMAAVALLLGAAVYFLEIRGAAEREEAEAVADRLLRFESEDVTGLTLQTPDETISLARTDDEWRITAPYDLAADQNAVTTIVDRLQSADRERVVEEQPESLERFGLAEPEVTVTLEVTGGATHTLAFGGGTPVGFNVFVKRGDADAVYTAASGIKDAVNKSLLDLRDRKILTFADADVQRVEIESDELAATVEREPESADGIVRWTLTEPLAASADAGTIAELLRRLRTSNATSFAADAPDDEQLASFGLDEPQATVRLWTGDDAARTLLIGAATDDATGYYARREGSDAVMIVPNNVINELPDSVDALRNRTVVELARDRVEAIEIEGEGAPIRIEKDGVDWRITAPRALDGDASAVSSLLTAALNLRTREFPEGPADAARFGFADPHARITFELEPLPGAEPGAEEGAESSGEATEGEQAGEQPAAGGMPADTVTLVIGAATEIAPEEADDPDATEPGEPEEAEDIPARYVMVEGRPTVYLVEEADLGDLDVDLFALRSKTLVSFAQSDLTRIELVTPEATLALTKDDEGNWTRDGEALGEEPATAVTDMLWRLNYLDMQGIVVEAADADAADLQAYGLATPPLRLRAFIGDETVADVAIGDDVPADQLQDLPPMAARTQTYATVAGAPGVFRVDANLRTATRDLLDILS